MANIPARRIGVTTGWFLIGTALLVDIVQFILTFFVIGLIVNKFISIAAATFFLLFLYIKNVPITSNTKVLKRLLLIFGGEAIPIPFLDAFFFWTIATWGIVRAIQKEDAQLARQAQEEEEMELARIQQQRILQIQLNDREESEEAA